MVSYTRGFDPKLAKGRCGRGTCCLLSLINIILLVLYSTVFDTYLQENKWARHTPQPRYLHEHHPPGEHGEDHVKPLHEAYSAQHGVSPEHISKAPIAAAKKTPTEHAQVQLPFLSLVRHIVLTVRTDTSVEARRAHHTEHSSNLPAVLLPPSMMLNFTLNGTVPVLYEFHDDRPKKLQKAIVSERGKGPGGAPSPTFEAMIQPRRAYTKKDLVNTLTEVYDLLKKAKAGGDKFSADKQYYQGLFVKTVDSYNAKLSGRPILVLGTLSFPAVEVVGLAVGKASAVYTVEHRPYVVPDRRIVPLSMDDFWGNASLSAGGTWDAIFAYGSIQHDGLGRFGDALNPFGDFAALSEAWALLKPGGLLFLTIPVGNDCLVFNAFRVYGRRRLALLLWGWSVLETIGFESSLFEANHCRELAQPTLVLQKISGLVGPGSLSGGSTLAANGVAELGKVPGLLGPLPMYAHPRPIVP